MAEQLSTQQVLLLNNLMYMTAEEPLHSVIDSDGLSVGQFLSKIDTASLQSNKEYTAFTTGTEWKEIITAVQKDDRLLNMEIKATHVDNAQNGGGGASAVFVDSSTNEAVVVFRGTANHEWKDNFSGGANTTTVDGVSTPQQENALDWYQSLDLEQYSSVTVSGHSKGGNKAKYITVMDDSVDRCLSFDGQGFSDEFIDRYESRIAANQDKISNNNIDGDYVNLLLNDIGNTSFYKGYGYGNGGFLENHCPNTFLDFHADGTAVMSDSVRDERMAAVDEFLNSYLRSLSPEDKKEALALIGDMVQSGFNGADANELLGILVSDDSTDHAANLAAYLLKYKEQNPELVDALKDILTEMKLDSIVKVVDVIDNITGWEHFDKVMDALGWLAGNIPGFVYDLIRKYLKEKGIFLTNEELKKLLGMLQTMADDMDNIVIKEDGADKTVSPTGLNRYCAFDISTDRLCRAAAEIEKDSGQLSGYARRIANVSHGLNNNFYGIKQIINKLEQEVLQEAAECKGMAAALEHISGLYRTHEEKIILTKH